MLSKGRFSMRSAFVITALAGCFLYLAPQLDAQFNTRPQVFDLLSETGLNGSRLGVSLRDIDADRANIIKLGDPRGVEVDGVQDGSPAAQAGIRKGDVLLTYNGESIMGAQQLVRLVQETPRDRKVRIECWREGNVSTLTVTTGAPRPMSYPSEGELELLKLRGLAMAQSIPRPELIWRTPQFGIECEPLESQLAEFFGVKHGVLVRSVVKDSPAAKAGLRAGDVITEIDKHLVSDPRDLTSYIRTERRSFGPVALEVTRAHHILLLKVTLAQDEQQ